MKTQEDLFSKALGIKAPWFIESVNFEADKGELTIKVGYAKGSEFEYVNKATGEIGYYKTYDSKEKTWRHMNFFQYRCYIKARIPRVDIGGGNIKQVKAPWEGIAKGFTLLFEALILQLAKAMTVHQISESIGVYDSKIWKILKLYTEMCRSRADYSEVKELGIDETAVRRGHNYVTLFVDINQKKTLYVTEGKGSNTVKEFVADLQTHEGKDANIEQVSCDMSPSFIRGVSESMPNAEITFDKFHVVKIINQAVDMIRKEEQKSNPILKNSRYVFLKNRDHYTAYQREKYEELRMSKLNIRTFKALQIREAFQQIYESGNKTEFEKLLKKWYYWATHCRIPEIIEAAKTIKRHWSGIVNWALSKINNGILEGFNSIFQAAKAKARGYKNPETIKTIIYILTGKLDFSIVNPFTVTHSVL